MKPDLAARAPFELWGGIECTVNRIGDGYIDQLELSGHATRAGDLELVGRLGISALRYPLLWERLQPEPCTDPDWTWADARLRCLQALHIRPIVGLVHHGSGPRHTSLVEDSFAEGLARHARKVAERYPWLECYTPVNEPLTTARFSGLYGHWYPHARDGRTFVRALLNQCRGVVLAMRAIRQVHSSAQLVQTEDLGKVFSTPALAYQADFENERRWLTWDLLCGWVDARHPLWSYLRWVGIEESEITWFLDNPCPPDVIGINYYVTSERFLDERVERYPTWLQGGNKEQCYADLEAVRVRAEGLFGLAALLGEAWDRYRRPLAVTEAHLACTREEQMRWLAEVWQGAQLQHEQGVDVRAVTAWSLLGSFDWDSLVTRCAGHYEPGVFDLRAPQPRPTALAAMIKDLAAGSPLHHPVLKSPGWWHRPERLCYPPVLSSVPEATVRAGGRPKRNGRVKHGRAARPLLITGVEGALGRALGRICAQRCLSIQMPGRRSLDRTDPCSLERYFSAYQPWAVIHTGGNVRVEDAERELALCFRENVEGPVLLAAACARAGVPLLTFSSDLVFDGRLRRPYLESDAVRPLSVYGRSQAEAEQRILKAHPSALVVRTGPLLGPGDSEDFVAVALQALSRGEPFRAAEDVSLSPTYVLDLAHACLDLLLDRACGVWHLSNGGSVSWAELARRAAELACLDRGLVQGCALEELELAAPRPLYSVLGSERGWLLPPLEDALVRYVRQVEVDGTCKRAALCV